MVTLNQPESIHTRYTPGPWRFKAPSTADHGNPWFVQDRDYHTLAIVSRSPREANARLIAAAPELLYACQVLVRFIEVTRGLADQPNEVRVGLAAIAKAGVE